MCKSPPPWRDEASAPQFQAVARVEAMERLPLAELARLGQPHVPSDSVAIDVGPPVDHAGRELFDPTASRAFDEGDETEQLAVAAAAAHGVIVGVPRRDRGTRQKLVRPRGRGRIREAPSGLLKAAADRGRTIRELRVALGAYLSERRPELIAAATGKKR